MFKDIFPLKIYEAEFPNFESIQQQLLDEIMEKFDANTEGYKGHRLFTGDALTLTGSKPHQFRRLHEVLKTQEVVKFINEHIKIYWDGLGYNPKFNPKIFHMWANCTGKKEYMLHHNHSPFEISGAFYVNATPEMGRLALLHPNEMLLSRLPFYNKEESLQGRYFWDHLVDPKPGKLVLFPGWLYHKTQPNLTDDLRVVLGLNSGGVHDLFEHPIEYYVPTKP